MERKVKKKHIDYSCGFPVILLHVPMVKISGEWIVDIDYEALAKAILLHLAKKPQPFTGNEIRFIRYYFGLNVRHFGHRFGVKHSAVLKWEQKQDLSACITWGIEKDIRLFIIDKLCQSNKVFRDSYKELELVQDKLENPKIHPITFEFSDGNLQMAC